MPSLRTRWRPRWPARHHDPSVRANSAREAVLLLAVIAGLNGCGETAPQTATPSTAPTSETANAPVPTYTTKTAPDGTRMRDIAEVTRVQAEAPAATRGSFDLTGHCNLERVSGTTFEGTTVDLQRVTPAMFTGWLVDPRRGTPGTDLRLVLVGVNDTPGAWTSRSVVRKANPVALEARRYQAGMLESSFAFHVDIQDLAPGTYHAYVVFDEASGGAFCDPGRQVRVTG